MRAFLPTDHLTLNLNTLLIETGGRRIRLEAGAGQTMGPHGGRIFATHFHHYCFYSSPVAEVR